ncbi:hypothetical protein D9758_002550 [Tetrapyrgos nigripes]|uniref:HTH CENPB-type domain-containing protein n=1 Tax=Tetrapyrgos nigripes TaxID=182062 RepID=A0A8H5GRQ4_9AGAR|nr:hypothetical protein D9758_002550 [Tetrapyrgos nigripes]
MYLRSRVRDEGANVTSVVVCLTLEAESTRAPLAPLSSVSSLVMTTWTDFIHNDYTSTPSTVASRSYSEMNQIESSIGPSRVMTRGQRRARDSVLSRGRNAPISRAGTPAIGVPSTNLMGSYPLTPDSSHSPYFLPSHSRSHSSSYDYVRDPSPALSTNTSLSSASGPNSQNDSTLEESITGRPKHRKQRLYNLDRQAICQYHMEHPTARQEDIARQYGVERSTISKILKYKQKWLNISPDETIRVAKHRHVLLLSFDASFSHSFIYRPSKFPLLELRMVDWISEDETRTKPLTDTRLRDKALEIARDLSITEDKFKASSGWVDNFKARHGIRNGDWMGDGKRTKEARALGYGPPMTPLAIQLEAQLEAEAEKKKQKEAAEIAKLGPSYQRIVGPLHEPWSQPALLTPDYSPVEQSQPQGEHHPEQSHSPDRLHPHHLRVQAECYTSHPEVPSSADAHTRQDLLSHSEPSSAELYPSGPSQLYQPSLHTSITEPSIPADVAPPEIQGPSEAEIQQQIRDFGYLTAGDAETAMDRLIRFFRTHPNIEITSHHIDMMREVKQWSLLLADV